MDEICFINRSSHARNHFKVHQFPNTSNCQLGRINVLIASLRKHCNYSPKKQKQRKTALFSKKVIKSFVLDGLANPSWCCLYHRGQICCRCTTTSDTFFYYLFLIITRKKALETDPGRALLKHNSFLGVCYFRSCRKSHKINFLWYDDSLGRSIPMEAGAARSSEMLQDMISYRYHLGEASIARFLMRLFIISGVWKIIPLSCHILELLAGPGRGRHTVWREIYGPLEDPTFFRRLVSFFCGLP